MKVLSFNILAPEYFLYFWRSSFGLSIDNNDEKYYNSVNFQRIQNITNIIKNASPDIICLQEITDQKYEFLKLENECCSISTYIANTLGYSIINQAFKKTPFKYDYPPTEQNHKYMVDTGVVTLIKNKSDIKHLSLISNSNKVGKSMIFHSGDGSPFTLDQFTSNKNTFYLVNIHLKMIKGHIMQSLDEIYQRISKFIVESMWSKTIIIGDFNSSTNTCFNEFNLSPLTKILIDIAPQNRGNDRCLIGSDLKMVSAISHSSPNILHTHINTKLPYHFWKSKDANYIVSKHNNEQLSSGGLTSDHQPMEIDIVL